MPKHLDFKRCPRCNFSHGIRETCPRCAHRAREAFQLEFKSGLLLLDVMFNARPREEVPDEAAWIRHRMLTGGLLGLTHVTKCPPDCIPQNQRRLIRESFEYLVGLKDRPPELTCQLLKLLHPVSKLRDVGSWAHDSWKAIERSLQASLQPKEPETTTPPQGTMEHSRPPVPEHPISIATTISIATRWATHHQYRWGRDPHIGETAVARYVLKSKDKPAERHTGRVVMLCAPRPNSGTMRVLLLDEPDRPTIHIPLWQVDPGTATPPEPPFFMWTEFPTEGQKVLFFPKNSSEGKVVKVIDTLDIQDCGVVHIQLDSGATTTTYLARCQKLE